MEILVWLQHPYTVTLARWLLAGVFLAAAAGKLADRRRFVQVVLAYKVLPQRLARLYAAVVPWIEAIVGLLLLLGLATNVAAVIGGVLLLSFIVAVGLNVARGRTELDCGCFGPGHRQKIGGRLIIRNIALVLLSLQVALFADGYVALDGLLFHEGRRFEPAPSVEGLLLSTLAVGGILLFYLLGKQIITPDNKYHNVVHNPNWRLRQ